MRSVPIALLAIMAGCGAHRSASAPPLLLADHIAAADRAHEPVVVEFGATWCAPCHQFAQQVLVDPRVQAALHGIAFVQYDIDTPAGTDAMKQCKIAAIPAVVAVARDGTPHVLVEGAEPSVDQLVAFLQQAKQAAR